MPRKDAPGKAEVIRLNRPCWIVTRASGRRHMACWWPSFNRLEASKGGLLSIAESIPELVIKGEIGVQS